MLQMREKQKCARPGVLESSSVATTKRRAASPAVPAKLARILRSRLDNVVYRSGFASSRDQARQLVRHGHFLVNGHKVDIPSYRVSESDIVEVAEKSRELDPFP